MMELMKRIEEEINSFPEGSRNYNFLRQLSKNLEPDCLRKSVRKELNESHVDVGESIRNYFKQNIIYTSALKAVDCRQSLQIESAHDATQLFYLNLLKKYVCNDKSSEKLKFFEESQTFLTKIFEDKQKSVEIFTKLVEDNINEFCIQFSEHVLGSNVNFCDWKKHFAVAIKQLSQRVNNVDSTNTRLKTFSPKLQNLLSKYYKELAEGIEILNKLLELFQQKVDCQLNQSTIASDRSVHLKFKIRCLELEIMISTYSEGAVKALKIIKAELNEEMKKTVDGISNLNTQLDQYQLLGPEYDQLVEKYQQLVQNIETQKLAIAYLKTEIAAKAN